MVDRAQRACGDGDDLVATEQRPLARGLGRAQPLDLLLAEDRVERDEPDLRAGLLVERGEGGVLDLEVYRRS